MANQETQLVDQIIVENRRKLLTLGGAALATMLLPKAASAATTIGDNDILNFALNLEYLEANFYYLAAFGTTINVANSYSTAAGAPVYSIAPSGGAGTAGTVTTKSTGPIGCKVPFTTSTAGAYAIETALEEGKHVGFLQTTLGSSAVVQPAINLDGGTTSPSTAAFNAVYTAAGLGASFDPFLNDNNFLLGSFIFEDVGVAAYNGALSLFSQTKTGNAYRTAATGILATEGYHAGLIRTSLEAIDPTYTNIALYSQKIATFRTTQSQKAAGNVVIDDYGVQNQTVQINTISYTGTFIANSVTINSVAFQRNTSQTLNIVTGGGGGTLAAPISPAKGAFFPAGMNGLIA